MLFDFMNAAGDHGVEQAFMPFRLHECCRRSRVERAFMLFDFMNAAGDHGVEQAFMPAVRH